MTIRQRMRTAAIVGFVAIVSIELMSFRAVNDMARIPERLQRQVMAVGLAIRDIQGDLNVIDAELSAVADAPTALRGRSFARRTEAAQARIEQRLSEIEAGYLGAPADSVALRRLLGEWEQARLDILDAIAEGRQIEAYTLAKTEGLGTIAVSLAALERMRLQSAQASTQFIAEAKTQLSIAIAGLLGFLTLAGITLLLMVRYVNRTIIEPTTEISSAIHHVAEGVTEVAIPHTDMLDEIGDIARSAEVFLQRAISIRDAQVDVLTGLPTREHLHERLRVLRLDPEQASRSSALLHLDIDRLGEVNDSLGRSIGDAALVRIAQLLQSWLGPDDMVARESGDSFVMLLLDCKDVAEVEATAKAISEAVKSPMEIGDRQVEMTCSIGLTLCQKDASVEDLLMQAENAVLEGRRRAFGCVQVYTPEIDAKLRHRRKTLLGLREALERDEIEPFFQPQIYAETGKLAGFEALVRWHHPERGLLSPWQFLDIAAEAGLLSAVTETMIAKATRQLSSWRRKGFDVPRISLNLAASDLVRPDFVDWLQLMVEREGLEPKDVCVELLESAMIEDTDSPVNRTLDRLERSGFPIELDDFGTGHAAISTLHIVNLSGLKIDQSFIKHLDQRRDQQHLTRGILRISNALNILTVAEGVESSAERALLVEFGCDILQGYLISPPLSASDATAWIVDYDPASFVADLQDAQPRYGVSRAS